MHSKRSFQSNTNIDEKPEQNYLCETKRIFQIKQTVWQVPYSDAFLHKKEFVNFFINRIEFRLKELNVVCCRFVDAQFYGVIHRNQLTKVVFYVHITCVCHSCGTQMKTNSTQLKLNSIIITHIENKQRQQNCNKTQTNDQKTYIKIPKLFPIHVKSAQCLFRFSLTKTFIVFECFERLFLMWYSPYVCAHVQAANSFY